MNKKNLIFFAAYLLISFLLLNKIFLTSGIILGGDWSLPIDFSQSQSFFNFCSSTWTNSFFGINNLGINNFPFALFIRFFSIILSPSLLTKIILVILYSFGGFSLYLLSTSLGLRSFASFLGGVIYITSPIFFNYTIMGWIYILIFLSFLPFIVKCFISYIKENNKNAIILASILASFTMMQSQSIIWLIIIFIFLSLFLVENRESFLRYLKAFLIIISLVIFINCYWLLPIIIFPDKTQLGSDIINSVVSLGITEHFYPINIIRIFGGLYNFSYETIVNNKGLPFFSFILPFFTIVSLLINKYKKLVIPLWLIALIPFFMYLLNFNRNILLFIPFSNVIRDFARFTVLSTFSYSILAAITLNFFANDIGERTKKIKVLWLFFIVVLFISIFPWWSGEMFDWQNSNGADIRLRLKNFPKEYFKVEENFSKKKLDQRIFYLPIGGTVAFEDDSKFLGSFHETQDIFAGFSPFPGVIGLSDRSMGYVTDYVNVLRKNLNEKLVETLEPINVKYFVVRKNMVIDNKKEILDNFNTDVINGKLETYFEGDKILVYAKRNFLPHFYVPEETSVSNNKLDRLIELFSNKNNKAVFFLNQNSSKSKELENISIVKNETYKNRPIIEYKKINNTKYRIYIHSAFADFPLIFSESFNDGWKVYIKKYENNLMDKKIDNYKIIESNEEDQANKDEVISYLNKGWITALGNKKGKIDFISKNFQGTIQNNNLKNGIFFETWFPQINKSILEISDENHLMVNGYANAWFIKINKILAQPGFYKKNYDGSYDMELIVEYQLQQFFYIGLIVSGVTLSICIGYLFYEFRKNKKNIQKNKK